MSLLRELIDEKLWETDKVRALLDAAVLVRRAGLEHLVCQPTNPEVMALAHAGEILERERRAALVLALRDPAKTLAEFDDGASLRRELAQAALAEARSNAHG